MLILFPDFKHTRQSFPDAILIFGIGLIGSAIHRNIVKQIGKPTQYESAFDWYDEKSQIFQINDIFEKLESLKLAEKRECTRISVIWSAGKSGFYSEGAELQQELANFKTILTFTQRIQDLLPACTIDFHFISSAGGIFEGCGYVDERTMPNPARPYGFIKLAQEQLLLEQSHLFPRIYRPSTIYGPLYPGLRCGLVSSLIRNGVLRTVTNILGHLHTLRDYVYTEDIGNFIAQKIQLDNPEKKQIIFHLSSGKSSSIFEVIKIVESLLNYKIYYKLEYEPSNSCDIVFSPDIRPAFWSPVDLRMGCERVLRSWMQ